MSGYITGISPTTSFPDSASLLSSTSGLLSFLRLWNDPLGAFFRSLGLEAPSVVTDAIDRESSPECPLTKNLLPFLFISLDCGVMLFVYGFKKFDFDLLLLNFHKVGY